ncbi:AmmeMemoRadiSam system protein B [Roseiflexus castenholzii]|uniref:AmmeMemoRadiSam system protein B n=1 Tax=Roseiflexus castenholzii TaxID=120962 RepID=UPI003C7D447C
MLSSTDQYPKLRAIDIRRVMHDGQPSLLLRDPLQISDRFLVISQGLGPALLFCDGRHHRATIAGKLRSMLGVPVDSALVNRLVDALDEAFLLDNLRFREEHARALARYRAAPFRPPALAGQSYPADPTELRRLLDDFIAAVGPVAPAPPTGRGVLSPHIDYARGGRVYARVWQRAAEMVRAAEIVLLIGTDHYSPEPVTLTRQRYATPLGVLPTDTSVVDTLATAIGEDAAFAGELYHRVEHSLELVVVWLQHMRRDDPCPVIPILVGSFARYMDGGDPATDPRFEALITALRRIIASRRAMVIISGDMSHVGPAFGGAPLSNADKEALRHADELVIDRMRAGDAAGFFRVIAETGDRQNICGLPPTYLALRLMDAVEGELTAYAQCPADDEETSVVSICGMVFG